MRTPNRMSGHLPGVRHMQDQTFFVPKASPWGKCLTPGRCPDTGFNLIIPQLHLHSSVFNSLCTDVLLMWMQPMEMLF